MLEDEYRISFFTLIYPGGTMLEDEDGIGVVHCYDPHTDTWVDRAPMLIPRSGAAACILNGLIYIIGEFQYLDVISY